MSKKLNDDVFVPRQTKMLEIAELFADEEANQKGFEKGSKKWIKCRDDYLEEALMDSILPGNTEYNGAVKKNPKKTTKRINPTMSDASKDITKGKFKEKRMAGLVSQLANYYFEKVLGEKVRGGGSDNKSFRSYSKGASKSEIAEVNYSRYKFDLYVSLVTATLVKLFSFNPKDLDLILEKTEITKDNLEKISAKMNQDNKTQFSEATYLYFINQLNKSDLMSGFKEKIKKETPQD